MTEQTPQQRSAELRRKIEAWLAVADAGQYGAGDIVQDVTRGTYGLVIRKDPRGERHIVWPWTDRQNNTDIPGPRFHKTEVEIGNGTRLVARHNGPVIDPAALRAAIAVLDKVDGWLCEKDAVGARLEWNRALHDAALSLLDALERELVLPDAPQGVKHGG